MLRIHRPKSTGSTRSLDKFSWPALWASIVVNVLAWASLLVMYHRTMDIKAVPELPRTPITWLKPIPVAAPATPAVIASHTQDAQRSQRRMPRIDPPSVKAVAETRPSPKAETEPVQASMDDAWTSSNTGLEAGTIFRPDPLQLRQIQTIAPQRARLKLGMRSAGGLAARARGKTCGALLAQWGGLKFNPTTAEAPLGMQPAGREAVWRSLQEEGCLD